MILPFEVDFAELILKPTVLPWARSFCPFRAYGMWLVTHPHSFLFLLEPLVCKECYNNNGKSQDDVTELMTIL